MFPILPAGSACECSPGRLPCTSRHRRAAHTFPRRCLFASASRARVLPRSPGPAIRSAPRTIALAPPVTVVAETNRQAGQYPTYGVPGKVATMVRPRVATCQLIQVTVLALAACSSAPRTISTPTTASLVALYVSDPAGSPAASSPTGQRTPSRRRAPTVRTWRTRTRRMPPMRAARCGCSTCRRTAQSSGRRGGSSAKICFRHLSRCSHETSRPRAGRRPVSRLLFSSSKRAVASLSSRMPKPARCHVLNHRCSPS